MATKTNTDAPTAVASTGVEAYKDGVSKALAHLKSLNINFLALDFDQTILQVHTGGRWPGTWEALAPQVRPMFRALIPTALNENFAIAIVTFSSQTDLIRALLVDIVSKSSLGQKTDDSTEDMVKTIPIRGGVGGGIQWTYNGTGSREGKQAHIASAAEELELLHQRKDVTKLTTVLIDDDAKNIRVALQNGVRAIWLNPSKPDQLLKDMQELI